MSTAASPSVSSLVEQCGPIVVMGVSGCGKSSVGAQLADQLGVRFLEGDRLHPPENVSKMRKGIPLQDADRWPWLQALGEELAADAGLIASCSALKRSYRDLLREKAGRPLTFLFLQGDRLMLAARMAARQQDYMPLSLLDSQLATLELPDAEPDVVAIDINQPLQAIGDQAITALASGKPKAS
ncbi:gluconokinase [Neorhizobium galegae]|uniref:gluconokinase n=1 Tax=Neorhizobium galegae TaxID=399 RepID=UPI001AE2F4CE|nr:gluconokinase [Neorhizobium galegae]MBP2551668.1 gluconokinase [Neorhizobium galegae]